MIPEVIYCDNLELSERIKGQDGVIVECGVWRGGMIAGIVENLGMNYETYLFDSFEGLPEAQELDGEAAKKWQSNTESPGYYDNCKAELEFASNAMKMTGTDNYHLIKGWFNETLPSINFEKPIVLLRLDGDWYDSTMVCLVNLYPYLAENGIIIIDDYYAWDGCSRAIHDFLSKNNLPLRIEQTKNGVCYIINHKNGRKF